MRLVLIHGINNQNSSASKIENQWMTILRASWSRLGIAMPQTFEVKTAYYGDLLESFSRAEGVQPMGAASQGRSSTELELYREFAKQFGVTDAQIRTAAMEKDIDMTAVSQALPHEGWFIAIVAALEKILPPIAMPIARVFLRQAAAYLTNAGAQVAIKASVKSQVFPAPKTEPTVVIAHSLGTVIGYELLSMHPAAAENVRLLVTMGSPIPVDIVANYLGRHHSFPKPPVAAWKNARDPEDFITLGKAISKDTLGFSDVEDVNSVRTADGQKHAIANYLSDPTVARSIAEALH